MWPICKISIVALERSNAALRHPITLRTADPRCHRLQSDIPGKRVRLRRRILATVISQPFQITDGLAVCTESVLDGLHHQVTDQVGVNALVRGDPTHRLPVTAVQCKRNPYPLTVIAAKLESIRTLGRTADIYRKPAIRPTIRHWLLGSSMKQQPVILHDPVNPFVIRLLAIERQHRPYSSITISGTIPSNLLDRLQQFSIVDVIMSLHHMTALYTKGRAHGPYFSSPENVCEPAIHFLVLAKSTASLRISFSSVLGPRAASDCLMRFWVFWNSESVTIGSLSPGY